MTDRERNPGPDFPVSEERIQSILEANSHGLATTHDIVDLCAALRQEREKTQQQAEALGYIEDVEDDSRLRDLTMLVFHVGAAQGLMCGLEDQTKRSAEAYWMLHIDRQVIEAVYSRMHGLRSKHRAGIYPWRVL